MLIASTTTFDYGCNTEIYRLIQIATDDAGSYPWLILRQIRECVTWALKTGISIKDTISRYLTSAYDSRLVFIMVMLKAGISIKDTISRYITCAYDS